MSRPLPRILAVPGNDLSRLSVPHSFLTLMQANRLAALEIPQTPESLWELVNQPFDFLLVDLTQPNALRTALQKIHGSGFPSDLQTGHCLALRAVAVHKETRVVIVTDNDVDASRSEQYEKNTFFRWKERVRHVNVKQARLAGRPNGEKTAIIPCDVADLEDRDPLIIDWAAAAILAFPQRGDSFRVPETAATS